MKTSNLDPISVTIVATVDRIRATDRLPLLPPNPESILRAGWDYTADAQTIDDPGEGLWRTSQFVPHTPDPGWSVGQPILALGMSVDQIEAGLWRQIRILPQSVEDRPSRREDQPFDCFAAGARDRRDNFLELFLGVHVRDLAIFLDHLATRDATLARDLMSKRFNAIGIEALAAIEWPEICHRRFAERGLKDVVPPGLALVLHASLAQYAQTHAAHLKMAFSKTGDPIGIRQLLDDLPTLVSNIAEPGTRLVGDVGHLQTWNLHSLQGWERRAQMTALRRGLLAGCVQLRAMQHSHPVSVAALISSVRSHPYALKHPALGSGSQLAKREAITRYGLTWRDDAAVNLLLIHEQKKEWEADFSQAVVGEKSSHRPSIRRYRSFACSIAAVSLFWLESNAPQALRHELDQLARSAKMARGHDIEPLCVGCTGQRLLRRARDLMPVVKRPDCLGYSAFAHPSLWLTDEIPEVAEFVRLKCAAEDDLLALGRGGGVPPSVLRSISYRGLGRAKAAQKRSSSRSREEREARITVRAAQALSMTMHAQSTDANHSLLVHRSLERLNRLPRK